MRNVAVIQIAEEQYHHGHRAATKGINVYILSRFVCELSVPIYDDIIYYTCSHFTYTPRKIRGEKMYCLRDQTQPHKRVFIHAVLFEENNFQIGFDQFEVI